METDDNINLIGIYLLFTSNVIISLFFGINKRQESSALWY